MKRILKTMLITTILLGAGTGGFVYWAISQKNAQTQMAVNNRKEQLDEGASRMFSGAIKEEAEQLFISGTKKNVIVISTNQAYSVANSKMVQSRLERLIRRTDATIDKPLIAYNPYGTRANSFYFYFETSADCYVKYFITSESNTVKDFVRVVQNEGINNCINKHEFLLTGLVPGRMNYMVIHLYDPDGVLIGKKVCSFMALPSETGAKTQIIMSKGNSTTESSHGLYSVFPRDKNGIYQYDNMGTLRGEIKTGTNLGKRIVFADRNCFYSVSKQSLVKTSNLGQILQIYSIAGYDEHVDFDYDGFGNLYVLAKKKGQFFIVRVSADTGKTSLAMSFDKKIQLTSISMMEKSQAFIGTSSPGGMMKVSHLGSGISKVSFVIGDKAKWIKTVYKKKMYTLTGKGPIAAGQNLLISNPTRTSSGKYSVSFLNKNNQIKGNSFYYEYLATDKDKKFKIATKITVPYVEDGGSGQIYGDYMVVGLGNTGKYSEYDKVGRIIKNFNVGIPCRSVIKNSWKQIFFY